MVWHDPQGRALGLRTRQGHREGPAAP